MKRALAALALCGGLIGGVAGPASATPPAPTGPVSGTERFDFGNGCIIALQEFNLSLQGQGNKSGTLTISGCAGGGSTAENPAPRGGIVFNGTFVFTAVNGATLTGTALGSLSPSQFVDLTLSVQSGTRQLKNLKEHQLRFESTDFNPQASGSRDPITGTLTSE